MFSAGKLHLINAFKAPGFLAVILTSRQDYIFLFQTVLGFSWEVTSLKNNLVLGSSYSLPTRLTVSNSGTPRHECIFSIKKPVWFPILKHEEIGKVLPTCTVFVILWGEKNKHLSSQVTNQMVLVTVSE